MTQDDINQSEWSNPENWSRGIYSSKMDSRVWVPKKIKSWGWTINFGHQNGKLWMGCIIGGIILFAVVSNIIAFSLVKK